MYVKDKAKVLEEVKKQMLEHITDEQTTTSSSNNVHVATNTEPQPPSTKTAKGLYKQDTWSMF